MEPISPELVLVDPELARVARERLYEPVPPAPAVDVTALRKLVDVDAEYLDEPETSNGARWARQHVVPALLAASLLANGLLFADLVSRGKEAATLAPAIAAPSTRPVAADGSAAKTRRSLGKKAEVERKLLAFVNQASPRTRLPDELIDPATDLAKNNLQAVCRRATSSSGFSCIVRPFRHAPKEGLYVRYRQRQDGTDAFTWQGYRRGKTRRSRG